MNDTRIEQLMHDVLDGVATDEERTRLEQRLAADLVLRERFDELRGMFDSLNRVPLVEPPAEMHAGLMRAIAQEDARRVRPSGWLAAFADAFRARPAPAFAMAALTIAALSLLLWSGARHDSGRIAGGDAPVAGTMAPPAATRAAVLESGDARVSVTALITDGGIVLHIDGAAPSGASLDVETGLPGIDGRIEGEGASLAGIGASTGRVNLDLDRDVLARLTIDAGRAPGGALEVLLITPAGVDRHEFALGPRGEGP